MLSSNKKTALLVAAASVLAASPLHAATVTLTATNPFEASSFASATSWSDGFAPSAANDYSVSSGFQLRTVANGGDATFGGNSLTLGDGTSTGILSIKNALNSTITINNLTLNNGEITNGGGGAAGTENGTFTFAGNVTLAPSTAANRINTTNSSRSLTVTALISGDGALNIIGGGTVTLSGSNSYSGTTAVSSGTLSIASIKNVGGGNSSLGAVTTAANGTIALGSTTTAGTLKYTGSGDTTDRVINLAGTTGGAILDQSGTGLLKFTSAFTATGAGSKTLTLQGSGNGEISGAIVDNLTGTNKTSLVKSGTGTWTLSGANTYSGGTNITAGTLAAGTDGAFGTSKIRMGGGTIASADGTARTISTGQVIDFAASSTFGSAATGNLKFTDGVGLGNGAKTATINNSVTEFSGIISDVGTANNNFTKAGNGTLILSGANTYSYHNTAIDAGTLALDYSTNNNSKLSDSAALILNSGTLTLAGASGDHTELVGSTTLGGAVTLNRSGENTAKIALGAITRNAGGALEVTSAGLATTTTTNVNDILNYVTLGGALATNDGSGNIVAYSAFTDVNRQGGGIASNSATNVRIIEAGAGSGVTLDTSLGTTIDINTLSNAGTGGASAVDIGSGNTLRLGAAGTIASAAGTAGLTISNGTLTAGGAIDTAGEILVANQSATATVIGSVIANNGTGVVSLTKSGTGTLTLTNANTHTGDTSVAAGTLNLANSLALQNSALAITNGNVVFDQSVASHAFTVGGLKGIANITLQDNASSPNAVALTVNQAASTTSTFAGVASGTGSLTKAGAGTLILSGTNTYTGGTTVNGGELQALVSTAAGAKSTFGTGAVTVNSGSTLRLKTGSTGNVQTWANDINLNSATLIGEDGIQTLNGTVTLTGSNTINSVWGGKNLVLAGLVKDGASAGSLNITGNTTVLSGANTYTGGTTLTSGNIVLGNASALGTGTLTIAATGQNAINTVSLAGAVTISNAIVLNNAGDTGFQMLGGGGNNVNLSGNITGTTTRLFLNNNVSADSAASFTLSGNNSFTTTTSVYVNRGSLRIGSATALGASTNTLHYDSNAGTLSFAGSYSIANNINFTYAAQNLDTEANNVTLSGIVGGSQKLTKIGTGTLTFAGANTYTGGTAVNAGTLVVGATGAIKVDIAGVTVASGATLAVNGTLSLTSGAATLVNNGGTISLDNTSSVLDLGTLFSGQGTDSTYDLITGTTLTTTGNFKSILFTANANFDTVTFDNTTGKLSFTLTAVPEPGTYGLIGAGALAAASVVRRRRRKAVDIAVA